MIGIFRIRRKCWWCCVVRVVALYQVLKWLISLYAVEDPIAECLLPPIKWEIAQFLHGVHTQISTQLSWLKDLNKRKISTRGRSQQEKDLNWKAGPGLRYWRCDSFFRAGGRTGLASQGRMSVRPCRRYWLNTKILASMEFKALSARRIYEITPPIIIDA